MEVAPQGFCRPSPHRILLHNDVDCWHCVGLWLMQVSDDGPHQNRSRTGTTLHPKVGSASIDCTVMMLLNWAAAVLCSCDHGNARVPVTAATGTAAALESRFFPQLVVIGGWWWLR